VHAARLERALSIKGLDPHAGFLHVDSDYRASLTWDCVELLRAAIDRTVFAGAAEQRFRRGDFEVDAEGVAWLGAGLIAAVVQKCWLEDRILEAVVEWLVTCIAGAEMAGDGREP
jgi:CRISPR/Cas system-associated endonuclease Cas1